MPVARQRTVLVARRGYSDQGDYIATGGVEDAISSGASGVVNVFTGAAQAEGQAEAFKALQQQQAMNQMPPWVMPLVLLGGGALLVTAILRRR